MQAKIAFVTGASRGIGRACALALARAGAKVVLGARGMDKLEELAAIIRSEGGEALPVALDLSSAESIKGAFVKALKEFGRVDILVNNAGMTRDTPAVHLTADDWDAVLQTNLTGAFLCIQQVLPPMMKERWGRIINLSSIAGSTGNAGQANYAASKAGLLGLTKTLAQEMASRNVTVNAVAPGVIETDMTAALSDERKSTLLAHIPLKRFGKPEDVAAVVRFLSSDEASYITGQVISVNGGLYM